MVLPFFFKFLQRSCCDRAPLNNYISNMVIIGNLQITLNSNRKMKKASSTHKLAGISQLKAKTNSSKKISAGDIQKEVIKNTGLSVQIVNCFHKESIIMYFNQLQPLAAVKAQLYHKLRQMDIKVQKIVGFYSLNSDFAFDYKFSIGVGVLETNIKLGCIYHKVQKGLDKYKMCCCLAIGGFSKVFLVRSKIDGKFLAAKFIDKSKHENLNLTLLQNQKQISLKLNSSFLVKTHEFIETDQFYVFIMDYCPGGELFYLLKHIKCMSEEQARVCFIQILLGIEYLHSCGYMYRDLKPQNILMDAYGFIKIADFGLSKSYSQKSYSFCGSVQYMAPEIIRGRGHEKNVDFYCLGALLYEMLVGHPPFYDSRCTTEQTKAKILYNQIQFPKDQLSQNAKSLIRKLTQKNEKERLGYFGGCKQIMTHPWIGRINRKMYEQKSFQPPFPVNLNHLNFDSDEIGQSQRLFQQRINSTLNKKPEIIPVKRQKFYIKKQKSLSSKLLDKSAKQKSSPYRNKSLLQIYRKQKKSPYATAMKQTSSYKKLKTLKNEQKSYFLKKKYVENTRLTENEQKTNKANLLQLSSNMKLKKKHKYITFQTAVQKSSSPLKKHIFRQRTNQNEQILSPKSKQFTSFHL